MKNAQHTFEKSLTQDWLHLPLPVDIEEEKWDAIIVDAPPAYNSHSPGRHRAIYETMRIVHRVKNTTQKKIVIFIDDCERPHERFFYQHMVKAVPDYTVHRNPNSAQMRCTFVY